MCVKSLITCDQESRGYEWKIVSNTVYPAYNIRAESNMTSGIAHVATLV